MNTYKAKKDVVVQGVNALGETVGPISFEKGSYSTNDPDEIAILDACATEEDNPVAFAPKEE
jgi:hypothetical protein